MTKRRLIHTIPRVPNNLPVLLDALVIEVLHSRRLGAETQSQLVERQPRQGLTAILEATVERPMCWVTVIIELIPFPNFVEIYLETGFWGKGVLRLLRGLLERMFADITERALSDSISRILALESQNYGIPLQGSEAPVPPTSQTTTPTKSPVERPLETVIYCPACGLENPGYARFCETCGTKLAR